MSTVPITRRSDIATLLRRLRTIPRGSYPSPRGPSGESQPTKAALAAFSSTRAFTPTQGAAAGGAGTNPPCTSAKGTLTPTERQRVRAYIVAAMSRGELSPASAEVFAGLLGECEDCGRTQDEIQFCPDRWCPHRKNG